jgi:hypothetical protein
MAHLIAPARDVLYLGRGPDYPMALEGALKLKEISYIHAEGYAAGEMKHGPDRADRRRVPVIVLAPSGPLFEKTVSNMQEVRARGGKIVLISDARGHRRGGRGLHGDDRDARGPPADRAAGLCGAGAAARLSCGGAQGHRRRPAAQPGEERHGRVTEQLPLGVADKLFLALDNAEDFPRGAHLLGNPRSAKTGSYFLRPLGMPVVEGYFGGDGARALEELDDRGAAAIAIEELSALLGSGIRQRLVPIVVSRWAAEPWIEGSYSHALPSYAAARERLANSGDDRIAFAGEAVSVSDYSTAHGAFDSGKSAVRKLFPKR